MKIQCQMCYYAGNSEANLMEHINVYHSGRNNRNTNTDESFLGAVPRNHQNDQGSQNNNIPQYFPNHPQQNQKKRVYNHNYNQKGYSPNRMGYQNQKYHQNNCSH